MYYFCKSKKLCAVELMLWWCILLPCKGSSPRTQAWWPHFRDSNIRQLFVLQVLANWNMTYSCTYWGSCRFAAALWYFNWRPECMVCTKCNTTAIQLKNYLGYFKHSLHQLSNFTILSRYSYQAHEAHVKMSSQSRCIYWTWLVLSPTWCWQKRYNVTQRQVTRTCF